MSFLPLLSHYLPKGPKSTRMTAPSGLQHWQGKAAAEQSGFRGTYIYIYGAVQFIQYNPSTVKTLNVNFGNEKLKFYKRSLPIYGFQM